MSQQQLNYVNKLRASAGKRRLSQEELSRYSQPEIQAHIKELKAMLGYEEGKPTPAQMKTIRAFENDFAVEFLKGAYFTYNIALTVVAQIRVARKNSSIGPVRKYLDNPPEPTIEPVDMPEVVIAKDTLTITLSDSAEENDRLYALLAEHGFLSR